MKKLFYTTAITCCVTFASQAHAQSMDYKTMQDMFGEPVTTSANGSPMRASDVPLDMTIITAEEIARYPATEIPDILRHYAGISVRQSTGTEYSVGIRGINSPMNERILVLVNGRQVFEDYFGLVNWSSIPVELTEIRQIEVVRGPNTALFGFNATSGVVNIITHNPLYDDTDVGELDAGINGNLRGSAAYTFQNDGNFGIRFSASGRTVDEDGNDINPNTASDIRDTGEARTYAVDAALQLNSKTQMRIEASRSIVDENVLDPYYDGYDRNTDTTAMRMNLTSDTDYGIIEASIYKNAIDAFYRNSTNGAGAVFGFDNDVLVAQLSDTFKVGTDHTFRIAGEYRVNDTDHSVSLLGGDLGTTKLIIKSLSGLWYWNVNQDLSVSSAIRYDHVDSDFDGTILTGFGNPYSDEDYSNRYDEFGYNLGLAYKLTDIDTIRLTAAKGIDLPSSFELGFQGGTLYGDPTTKASSIFDYQLGYERQLSYINGGFKATAYYQKVYDQQGFVTGGTGNIGDIDVYGFEVGVDGVTDNGIRWGANYSYAEVDQDFKSDVNLDLEDETSNHIINANIGYSPTEQWDMDMFASYQSSFDQVRGLGSATDPDVSFDIDPDVILDARIAYKPTDKWTISLNGRGLFGDNDQTSYGEEVDTQIFLRTKYEF